MIDIKICSKCKISKSVSEFYKNKYYKDGLHSTCKECDKQYQKSDKYKETQKKYYLNNIEKFKLQREKDNWKRRGKYKESSRKYYINRLKTDSLFKLSHTIRNKTRKIFHLKNYPKSNKTLDILGCTFEGLKKYFEDKFEPWMNWDNYGKYNGEFNYGWDIDHIIPLSSAKTEDELIKLNHYTNLQPLDSKTNRDIKKNKLIS